MQILEIIGFFLLIWAWHLAIAAVPTAVIVFFGKKRVCWNSFELLAFILPFLIWAIWMGCDSTGKTLANMVEPFWFAPAIPIAALARVIVGGRVNEKYFAGILIGVLCLVAVGFYLFTPGLPE